MDELRDQLAGHALQGLTARYGFKSEVEDVAGQAYRYADAMLKARGAQPAPEEEPEPAPEE